MRFRVEAVVMVDSKDVAINDNVMEIACFDVEASDKNYAEELVSRLLDEKKFKFLYLQSFPIVRS